MQDILIKIFRSEQTEQGALGTMVIDKELFCTTLEPDSKDQTRSQTKAGVYYCKRFHGNIHKNTFEIIVPGHTAVLFHAGNIEAHSLMCVLLGQYPGKLNGERAVLNSGNTFKKFMGKLENIDSFYIEFIDLY